jgi:hypothetical protein
MSVSKPKPDNYNPIFVYKPLPNEIERKQPLTEQDIDATLLLFYDFYIEPPSDFYQIIKSFTRYSELENWRRNYILKNMPNFPTL